ncbi:uncharacterized protein LOC135105590 [Scylla paramamosain]|uniref:uncharacterized protein LOC135105590 n=1 Tax=Scylla paramamosain TaxID=85552 RepID=UPI0030833A5C
MSSFFTGHITPNVYIAAVRATLSVGRCTVVMKLLVLFLFGVITSAAPPPTIPLHQQHVNDGDEYPKFLRDIPSLSSIFGNYGVVLPNGRKRAPATENPLPPLADRPFLRDPQSHCSDSRTKHTFSVTHPFSDSLGDD